MNGLSIVGGWGDASGQGGDVTKNSDFNKLFAGCPLNIATHVRDRAAQIQENEQKARNDQAPSAPGRFSLFRIWLSCKGAHYVAFAISWSYQMMIVAV